jgi:exopolyphosphatase/pppGpp-phosphohydrolase
MSHLASTADKLRAKIEKLLHLHTLLEASNEKLTRERADLLKTIEDQKLAIRQLEDENKLTRLAQKLPETGNLDLKLKINELVREIDKCIALLNR